MLQLEYDLEAHITSMNTLNRWLENHNDTIDKYRGRPQPAFPDMKLQYDLNDLRNSKEFRYAAYNTVTKIKTAASFANNAIETLEGFLIVLEEYD